MGSSIPSMVMANTPVLLGDAPYLTKPTILCNDAVGTRKRHSRGGRLGNWPLGHATNENQVTPDDSSFRLLPISGREGEGLLCEVWGGAARGAGPS